MSEDDLQQALHLLRALEEHKRYNRCVYFKPYPKQLQFFAQTRDHREVMFMAGNQVGKSEAGSFAIACHMTGEYPEWWPGRKFDRPTKGWIAGKSSSDVRNVAQTKLCGQYGVPSAFGTGMIPKELFADKPTLARGVTDAYDTIQVYHSTDGVRDGVSVAAFKSYEQGRDKFQGETLDWGWADEEDKNLDVYSEFLTRIRGNGSMIFTATPLLGLTPLIMRFMEEGNPDRAVVSMSLDEAEHWSEEEKKLKLAAYPAHERDSRRYGTPMMGEGRVFPYDEAMLSEPFLDYVPVHWGKIWGIDFGIGHPFAAVLIAWDRDNDVIHVLQAIRMVDDGRTAEYSQPLFHAQAMKNFAANVPVAWPHDGAMREKGGGGTVASIYRRQGLLMLPGHATHPEGGYSTEAGIKEIDERIVSGRFKVSAHLSQWFEEYRFYHRSKGMLVKVKDDLMSATRIALMMKRCARTGGIGNFKPRPRPAMIAQGVDFDPFSL